MATEGRLRNLALHVRNLLDCDQVSLCLCCPEPALCHPLLRLFSSLQKHVIMYYSSPIDSSLLSSEYIWALCDIAAQSGRCINRGELYVRKDAESGAADMKSVAVVALERPQGIAGFLFCTSREASAFQSGECRLLSHYLPKLSLQVERILSDDCRAMKRRTDTYTPAATVQEQNAFISMVSHELRVPLTAIKGYAGLLQAYGSSDLADEKQVINTSRRQHYLNVILEQTSHLEVLIGDVLDISRIQTGRLALHCKRVNLAQLCDNVAQLMQHRVEQQESGKYRILCNIDSELPYAWADPDRVQQVLTNLVENAVKYSPAGGLIEVSAHYSPSRSLSKTHTIMQPASTITPRSRAFIYITVRDSGIGIPLQQQRSLFRPFTRLEHPATRHISGAGLGLYIARRLVEAMHGQVMLNSSEGKGTSITFSLPIAQVSALASSLSASVSL